MFIVFDVEIDKNAIVYRQIYTRQTKAFKSTTAISIFEILFLLAHIYISGVCQIRLK